MKFAQLSALVLCMLTFNMLSAADEVVLARQNFDKEWVIVSVPAAAPVQQKAGPERLAKSLVAGTITFNITYDDVDDNTNFGFDDPSDGATRRSTLESVLTYIGELLNHTATIDVVCDTSLNLPASGTLASAGTYFNVASNGFKPGAAYTHITTGTDPFGSVEDIFVEVNFGKTWNSDTGSVGVGEFDLYSVLLHEITHGLGITSTIESNGAGGLSNDRVFTVFDSFIYDNSDTQFINPSTFVRQGTLSDLTTGSCFFKGPNTIAFAGQNIEVYTPSTFSSGSSIAHWEPSYDSNAVMNPSIATNVERRVYSAFELNALSDLGYSLGADLSIEVTTPATEAVSNNFSFVVEVTNDGPMTATNITVSAPIPTDVTYVSDTGGGDYVNGTGVWSIASLASGADTTLTITVSLDKVGSYTFNGEVTAVDQADIDSTPNTGQDTEDDSDNSVTYSGFVISKTKVNVAEDGSTEDFTVVLTTDPGATPVVIRLTDNDSDDSEIRINGQATQEDLTFNTGNWNIAQTVTITGQDDSNIDGSQEITITATVQSGDSDFTALSDKTVAAHNEDDGEGSSVYAEQIIINGSVVVTGSSLTSFTVSGATGSNSGSTWTVTLPLDNSGEGDANLVFWYTGGTHTVPINVTESIVPLGSN